MATGLPSEYDVIAKSLRRSRFFTVIRDHSVRQRHLSCSHTKHSFVSMLQGRQAGDTGKKEEDRSKKLSPRILISGSFSLIALIKDSHLRTLQIKIKSDLMTKS